MIWHHRERAGKDGTDGFEQVHAVFMLVGWTMLTAMSRLRTRGGQGVAESVEGVAMSIEAIK